MNNKYQSIEVLITTMHKSVDDVLELFSFWNLQTDAIVANQCNEDNEINLVYKEHNILLINSRTRGVSKNRNILLQNLRADLGVFLDDDCTLVDGYSNKILKSMNDFHASFGFFNGFNDKNKLINFKKTGLVKRFSKISNIGGPGIVVSKRNLGCYRFNEMVGTPNKIYCGEDSLFAYSVFKKKETVLYCDDPVFKVVFDIDNSSYLKEFDEQFFVSKGAINKVIHPLTFRIYRFLYSFVLKKRTHRSFSFISKNMKKGQRFVKKGSITYD